MNQIDRFELERIYQTAADIASYVITDTLVPDKIRYRAGTMDLQKADEMEDFYPGDNWGGFDRYGWFRVELTVPERMQDKQLWLEISQDKRDWNAQNPQFLLYCNGKPLQGLDINHEECLLRRSAAAGERLCIDLDAWSGMTVRDRSWDDRENRRGLFSVRFYCADERAREFYYDLLTPLEVARYAGEQSEAGRKILSVLARAVKEVDLRVPHSEAFQRSVARADELLKKELYLAQNGMDASAACVGHTHIDVAWLWQFSHTRNKAQRSFSTALKLLEEYPDYIFMSSQPQLYEFVREALPEQFEKIKDYVREGRWEPEGGMWVEADCNLTSGESLVRQFLMGKKYFREMFDRDNVILWLPDVFGYSAALPQICKKCGIRYFMTTKISWNELDKIPYDTFLWKGIDGTEILAHFAPARRYDTPDLDTFGFARNQHITSYNAILGPDYVMGGFARYSQKSLNQEFLIPYGYGDGGGGTTREMIEKGRRMNRGIPGCPRTELSTARRFFERLEEQVKDNPKLPVWDGELYLEFHRGTYTTAAMVKKMNRRAESLLQRTEFLMSAASARDAGFTWDRAAWEKMLRAFLTNQFHDILPGSAITEVYGDVKDIYAGIFRVMEENGKRALEVLAADVPAKKLAVLNTLGFSRSGKLEFSGNFDAGLLTLTSENGRKVFAQRIAEGRYLANLSNCAAGARELFEVAPAEEPVPTPWKWDGSALENELLRVVFAKDGTLQSVYDKEAEREVLSGPGNVFETYEDRPYQYDGWEISPYYREKRYVCTQLDSMELTEMGPVRACIRQKRTYVSSVIWQDIYFYSGSKRIDFHTRINWQESHILLKTVFPVDILANQAVYEIQFGTVQRPTHTNTSWDAERFETCAQRFADLSEPDYGAALLNDCKYGYDIHDAEMRLTLLRSPSFPNTVDQGDHEFIYSFLPHQGDYRRAGIQKEAYDLNQPLLSFWGTAEPQKERAYQPLFVCDQAGVFVETVKPAEDGDGFIARCYEGFGCRCSAKFRVADGYCARECTMLEGELDTEAKSGSFREIYRPFEIKTYRISRKDAVYL